MLLSMHVRVRSTAAVVMTCIIDNRSRMWDSTIRLIRANDGACNFLYRHIVKVLSQLNCGSYQYMRWGYTNEDWFHHIHLILSDSIRLFNAKNTTTIQLLTRICRAIPTASGERWQRNRAVTDLLDHMAVNAPVPPFAGSVRRGRIQKWAGM